MRKIILKAKRLRRRGPAAVIASATAVFLGTIALPAENALACKYVPEWYINVYSGSSHSFHYFHNWYEQEKMLSFVEAETNPANGLTEVTISNGGRCLDGGPGTTSGPAPSEASSVPHLNLTPMWTVKVYKNNPSPIYRYYHSWYQRFAMLDYVVKMDDPYPRYGVPIFYYVVITDHWRNLRDLPK